MSLGIISVWIQRIWAINVHYDGNRDVADLGVNAMGYWSEGQNSLGV